MTFETILYGVENDIATITLNRPNVMNGLNTQMRREILTAVHRAEVEARVLIITGAGKGFCSGADLKEALAIKDLDLGAMLRDEYEPMLHAIYDCSIPTICAVNGAAAGAGANLALAADIVIAKDSVIFLQAFARIGLVPDAGGSYWLPRQMGVAKAMGAALLAEPITAMDAANWGMIWQSVPDDEFDDVIAQRAKQLANGPSESYRLIKQQIRSSLGNQLGQQLELEAELQAKAGATDDHKEGINAFLEKRKPNFKGR